MRKVQLDVHTGSFPLSEIEDPGVRRRHVSDRVLFKVIKFDLKIDRQTLPKTNFESPCHEDGGLNVPDNSMTPLRVYVLVDVKELVRLDKIQKKEMDFMGVGVGE